MMINPYYSQHESAEPKAFRFESISPTHTGPYERAPNNGGAFDKAALRRSAPSPLRSSADWINGTPVSSQCPLYGWVDGVSCTWHNKCQWFHGIPFRVAYRSLDLALREPDLASEYATCHFCGRKSESHRRQGSLDMIRVPAFPVAPFPRVPWCNVESVKVHTRRRKL